MSQSSSSVIGNSSDDNRVITCYCGLPVKQYTSKRPQSNGFRFIRCPKKKEEHCLFFEWIDDGQCMRCAGTIASLEASIRDNQATIGVLEARIVDLLVSERVLQLKLEERDKNVAELQQIAAECDARAGATQQRLLEAKKKLQYAYLVDSLLVLVVLSIMIGLFQEVSSSSLLQLGP